MLTFSRPLVSLDTETTLPAGVRIFRGKFQARLWKDGAIIHLGTFDTLVNAAAAVKQKRLDLNIPERHKDVSIADSSAMYAAGVGMRDTAKHFGVSYGALRRIFKQHGVPIRTVAETQRKIGQNKKNTDDVGYKGHHRRVSIARGKPQMCEECGTTDPEKRYERASLTHNYADINDYKRLCCSCHRSFDGVIRNIHDRQRRKAALDNPRTALWLDTFRASYELAIRTWRFRI